MFGKKRTSGKLNWNHFKKGRKYPIRRDETGRSARQRAFELFELDYAVDKVAEEVEISRETARRYHYDWGKRGKGWETRHYTIKHMWKTNPEFSERFVDDLAEALGMTKTEVIGRLQQPWGLKRALLGRWPNRYLEGVRSGVEARLSAALDMVALVEMGGTPAEELMSLLHDLVTDAKRKRKDSGG